MEVEGWECTDITKWKQSLSSYKDIITQLTTQSIAKSTKTKTKTEKDNLVSLDEFYTNELPDLIKNRNPNPYITTSELANLMRWKLTRGKWRPRLLDFVSSLDEALVKSVSERAFKAILADDISKAITDLSALKGVGPATASAVLAAYAPHIAPFMSDEAMVAALGHSKDYTLKQYLVFADKLQAKAKELSVEGDVFTPSDVERALWSWAVRSKLPASSQQSDLKSNSENNSKKKRKR